MKQLFGTFLSTTIFTLVALTASTPAMAQQCYAVVTPDHAYPADGLDSNRDEGHYRQCLGPFPTSEQQQHINSVLKSIQKRQTVVLQQRRLNMLKAAPSENAAESVVQKAGSTFFFFESRSDYESYFRSRDGVLGKTPTGACGDTRLFPSSGLVSAVFDTCAPVIKHDPKDRNLATKQTQTNQNPVESMSREYGVNTAIARITTKSQR